MLQGQASIVGRVRGHKYAAERRSAGSFDFAQDKLPRRLSRRVP
jgi:hypothetical protein